MNRSLVVDFIFKRFNRINYVFRKNRIFVGGLIVEIPEIEKTKEKKITILGVPIAIRRYRGRKNYEMIRKSGKLVISLNIDIIGEIHDYLSLDIERERGRVVELPIVDLIIYHFYAMLKDEIGLEYHKFNKKHSFAICVTHDVDRIGDNRPFKTVKCLSKGIMRRNFKLIGSLFSGINHDFQVQHILDLEKKYDVDESTWFFLTSTRKMFGFTLPKNADYELGDKYSSKALDLLKYNEIGLHIPFIEMSSANIKREKQKLNKFFPVKGTRAHYLKGEYPNLLVELEKAGFIYDSTFGSNTSFAFRFGTSFPFQPILGGNKTLKIFEVPLNIMDVNISSFKEFKNYVKKLFSILKVTNGVVVINWHPNNFNSIEYGDIYEKCFDYLLSEGRKNRAWMTSMQKLVSEVKTW